MKFHLDENVDHALAHVLRREGFDVTDSTTANLRSAPDPAQLRYALENKRVLITFDDDLLSLAAEGTPHHGIIFLFAGKLSLSSIVQKILRATSDPSSPIHHHGILYL